MDKKAFEIQFNWLFVLVAGAAILLFFAVIVAKQKSASETSTKAAVLKSVEAIIAGASVSTDTTNIINIQNSEIEVSCGRISIKGISNQYENLILFAPSLMKGDKLITQTLAFSTPYRATNLLYMTSPQIRYIVIGDSSLAKDINKTMPSSLKKEFYQSAPEISNLNNYKVKFIIFGEMIGFPKQLAKMPDIDVAAIRINGDAKKGTIEFFQKDGSAWLPAGSASYVEKQALIGAAYTDTLEMYKCSMQNAIFRLNIVTKIYAERTKKLVQEGASKMHIQCSQSYNNALNSLNKIYEASSEFSDENVGIIASAAEALSSENQNAQIYSCPLIY